MTVEYVRKLRAAGQLAGISALKLSDCAIENCIDIGAGEARREKKTVYVAMLGVNGPA